MSGTTDGVVAAMRVERDALGAALMKCAHARADAEAELAAVKAEWYEWHAEAGRMAEACDKAEAERDEALAEATRLADILTNCGYWG